MKESCELVIVMPIGPAAEPRFVADTLASIRHYTHCTHKVVIADDSQKGTGNTLLKEFPNLVVLPTKKNLGKVAGLYINLAHAYRYALQHYDFRALLKMDDDALMIGASPEREAVALFAEQVNVGMAGRYISGRFSPDSYGNIHDNYWPRKQLIKDACSWKIIRRPRANWRLRQLLFKAMRNGYELGENIQGGAYFMNPRCLQKLAEEGLLPNAQLGAVNFGEDLLFSLLTRAVDFKLTDLAMPGGPIGCAWTGLPAPPEVLLHDRKKLIHSTRFWKEMDEAAVRKFFQSCRAARDVPAMAV